MKRTFLVLIGIIIVAAFLTAEFYIGYEMGYNKHKEEANARAKEMIDNEEIPNFSNELLYLKIFQLLIYLVQSFLAHLIRNHPNDFLMRLVYIFEAHLLIGLDYLTH